MKRERNTNIEILRLLLMCFILCWHILIHGLGLGNVGLRGGVMLSLFAPATYCFMYITGFYGIRFSQKSFYKIVLQLIITAVSCCSLSWILFGSFNIQHFVGAFVPLSTSFWWFMTNYLIIMLLSPIINKGLESITKEQFGYIVKILLAIQFISYIKLHNSAGSSFLGLFTVFLLGRFCGMYNVVLNLKKACLYFIIAWAFQMVIMIMCYNLAPKYLFTTLNYNTIPLMAMSVMLFYIFYSLPSWTNCKINTLLSPTLFIYLITEGLSKPLYVYLYSLFSQNLFIFIFTFTLLIASCLSIGYLINLISDKIILALSKKLPLV